MVWVESQSKTDQAGPMGDRGLLTFTFPKVAFALSFDYSCYCINGLTGLSAFGAMQVDMPLNVVLVSVNVPEDYRYGEFTVRVSSLL